MPFLPSTSETETIVGIQFGIFSPDEIIRRSVVEITNHNTQEGKIGGLFDPRMGVLENGKNCRSCFQNNHKCQGHWGYYKLARPVYYIQFFKLVLKVLRCCCMKCGRLLIDKEKHSNLLKLKGEARWKQVLLACQKISRCGEETVDGCGARQPRNYTEEDICKIFAEWKDMEIPADTELPEGAKVTGESRDADGSKVITRFVTLRKFLEPEYVHRLLKRISDEDVDFMGFSRYWCRPDWMMCTVLAIPPPQVRPSVLQDNNQRSEDDLTQKLVDIIKTNSLLTDKIAKNVKKKVIDEWTNVLQYHIATFINNEIPGVAPSAQRSGRPLKSVQQRLGSKEGRIRNNLQGKRVEHSARTVITPDPNLSIKEIGVPIKIASNLTYPERVTAFNINKLYRLIQNGPDVYPGAKTIVRSADNRMISLKHVTGKDLQLFEGDIVNRHLMDGDYVLFNRQPSLHRMSMMGHQVRVLPYNTFRLNVSVTAPYNADFDGDEMNLHAPQSEEAAMELREIAAVPLQIVSPRDSKPIVSVVQDTLVGVNRFMRNDVRLTMREAMNMLIHSSHWSGFLPEAIEANKGAKWTGQQIVSVLLPPLNLQMPNGQFDDERDKDKEGRIKPDSQNFVRINNGVIEQGVFDKSVFSSQLIHLIYNDYGPQRTVEFLDSLQRIIANHLINSGFSVGLSDLIADDNTRKEIDRLMGDLKVKIENIIQQVHLGLFDNSSGRSNQEEFERLIFGELNQVVNTAGKLGRNSLADNNRMTNMIKAGSKGSNTNVAQMIAVLGQQNVEGKRIPYGLQDRTLPHFKRYDDGAAARGFIESSFIKGLTPSETFFHAMSGREGLIDTAVKSVTGDTPIIVLEDGKAKRVLIGDWIDTQLAASFAKVEHFEQRNLELLQLSKPVFIPTTDGDGKVTWGDITAITRHDPGDQLYEIKTLGGKSVIVTESKALLVWNATTKQFEQKPTPDVVPGDFVPVTMNLAVAPITVDAVKMSDYLPKDTYLYGTDFHQACHLMKEAMGSRDKIPVGWWEENNGKTFTLPYNSKAKLQRMLVRSNTENIKPGSIYPFTTNRSHARIPDTFVLNNDNGIMIGLFLAEGNVDVKSGYVQITNKSVAIREFVKEWFENQRIEYSENVRINHIGATSTDIRGFSTILAKFMDIFVGHGAQNKRIPDEALLAPEEFVLGLLNGYFSGDGTVSENSIECGSASSELIDGISMLCTRIGVFGKVFKTHLESNNFGTETILPTYRLSIRANWATRFAEKIQFLDEAKEEKRKALKCSATHRNFSYQNDCVLDEIVEINIIDTTKYPKVYDLTVPSTVNFGLANGLHVVDTADTGYLQRQLVKAMEDLMIQHDKTVRDAAGTIIQFSYGEDGTNSTKIEYQQLNIGGLSDEQIRQRFAVPDAGGNESEEFIQHVIEDRKMLVEGVFSSKLVNTEKQSVAGPVHLDRTIRNIVLQFNLNSDEPNKVTGPQVLATINRILERTMPTNKIWAALLRYHMNPQSLQRKGFTQASLEILAVQIINRNWSAWCLPGEMVGIIAAQSIGEPSTQMTLNTFHLAGVASKSAVTRGIPRLKELLKATKNPKASSLNICLRPEIRKNKEDARRVSQELEFTLLQDIVKVARIYFDPRDDKTIITQDQEWLSFFLAYEGLDQTETQGEEEAVETVVDKKSPWIMRLELDRDKMFMKNITMEDVMYVVNRRFGSTIVTSYTDYNADELVVRIRMEQAADPMDDLVTLKKLQNNLLTNTLIRGVTGLKSVTFSLTKDYYYEMVNGKYEKVEQFVLDTDGTNFLDVVCHPDIDSAKLYSNNIHDIYANLGVEATRAVLLREISGLFEDNNVNYRHFGLLCDVICSKGKLMTVDRYGINKNNIGPLAKASFEQTEDIMLRAALFGELDPVTGVSANIMTGQPIRGGTSYSSILLDEDALRKFMSESTGVSMPVETQQEFTEEDEDDILYAKRTRGAKDDPCALPRLRLEASIPEQKEIDAQYSEMEITLVNE